MADKRVSRKRNLSRLDKMARKAPPRAKPKPRPKSRPKRQPTTTSKTGAPDGSDHRVVLSSRRAIRAHALAPGRRTFYPRAGGSEPTHSPLGDCSPSADVRVTIPSPPYDQNCRELRSGCTDCFSTSQCTGFGSDYACVNDLSKGNACSKNCADVGDCTAGQKCINNNCAECDSGTDCPSGAPICDADGFCIQCDDDTDCASGKCSVTEGRCIHCVSLSDCVDPAKPQCVGNGCRACTSDSSCTRFGTGMDTCQPDGTCGPA